MADFNRIIELIEENIPDNNAKQITAQKVRETLEEFVNETEFAIEETYSKNGYIEPNEGQTTSLLTFKIGAGTEQYPQFYYFGSFVYICKDNNGNDRYKLNLSIYPNFYELEPININNNNGAVWSSDVIKISNFTQFCDYFCKTFINENITDTQIIGTIDTTSIKLFGYDLNTNNRIWIQNCSSYSFRVDETKSIDFVLLAANQKNYFDNFSALISFSVDVVVSTD